MIQFFPDDFADLFVPKKTANGVHEAVPGPVQETSLVALRGSPLEFARVTVTCSFLMAL